MENKQLIKKYALSLYQVGEKENALDEIQKGIHVVNSLHKSSNTFRYFLLTKKITDNDKKVVLSNILKDYCSTYVLELISIIIEKGDIKSLNAIIKSVGDSTPPCMTPLFIFIVSSPSFFR